MNRNKKQFTTQFILLGLLLIGVVYAILQANLQINGTAKIQANTWDIHFDNIQVNANSVAIGENDSAATIDPENNCKVDFEVTLSIPGDFYEFTIDVVNAGTIDGMIGELNKTLKVNNEVVEETPDYLNYSITYSDGVEIEENHKISAGTTETYLVRLEFKTDIEELPSEATISTSLEPQYLQADSTAIPVFHLHSLYSVFEVEKASGSGFVVEYTGQHNDSFTEPATNKIYSWYAKDNSSTGDSNAVLILNKWNVIFAGFCWQMFRTTDTGGIKLIYNGIPNNGKCNATGTNQQIGTSPFNTEANSPAFVGYMYNPNTLITQIKDTDYNSDNLFGSGVSFSNGIYTLTNTTTSLDNDHHYTCNTTLDTCQTVRYYYYRDPYSNKYYVELSDGRTIEEALEDMLTSDNVNQTNSTIKTFIDAWYQSNLINYTDKLEDTIFCNNRRISNIAGWNPNGGNIPVELLFISSYSTGLDLYCSYQTDQFCMENQKARLTYPVGLITAAESYCLDNKKLKYTSQNYLGMSPRMINANSYIFGIDSNNGASLSTKTYSNYGVRPVVSLKPGTQYRYGDGSKNNPYIVE